MTNDYSKITNDKSGGQPKSSLDGLLEKDAEAREVTSYEMGGRNLSLVIFE